MNMIDIVKMHTEMTADLHPAFSNTDKHFLTVALAGEIGELCNMIKKRWRDKVDLGSEIRDECADIRIYLALLAHCYQCDMEVINCKDELHGINERQISLRMQVWMGRIADFVYEEVLTNDLENARQVALNWGGIKAAMSILHAHLVDMAAQFDMDLEDFDAQVQDKMRRVRDKRNAAKLHQEIVDQQEAQSRRA